MIIPVGHASGGLHQRPWMTYGILALCAVIFAATDRGSDSALGRAERQLDQAFGYWEAHPYLEPPARLREAYGDPGEAARTEFRAAWDASGRPPVPADVFGREQAALDAQVAQAEGMLRQHVWFRWGLVPAAPTPQGLFGHLFLHAGWLHLLGNLLFLMLCGPFVEERFGRSLYALFFLAAGLVGAAFFVAREPTLDGPLIGASGAVAGAMGAFLVWFWRSPIRFFYWLGFFAGRFSAPAWLVLPLWFAHELFSAALLDTGPGGGGGVAYWAHVGGFLFGTVVALVVRASGTEAVPTAAGAPGSGRRVAGREAEPRALAFGPSLDDGTPAGEGRPDRTLRPFAPDGGNAATPTIREPRFPAALLDGPFAEAASALQREVEEAVAREEVESAIRLWLRLVCLADRLEGDPDRMLRLAGWLRRAGHGGAATRALWAALAGADAEMAARVARVAAGSDPVVALRAARAAVTEAAADERAALQSLAAEAEREVRARGIVLLPEAPSLRGERPSSDPPPQPDAGAFDPADLDRAGAGWAPGPFSSSSPAASSGSTSPTVASGAPDYDALVAALSRDEVTLQDGDEAALQEPHARGSSSAPLPTFDADPGTPEVDAAPRPPAVDAGLPATALDGPQRPPSHPSEPGPLDEDLFDPALFETGLGVDDEKNEPGVPSVLRTLRVLEATPQRLEGAALWLELRGKGSTRLPLSRVEALAAAGIQGLGRARPGRAPKAVLLIDLVVSRPPDAQAPLTVVRLRSDGFDPRRLSPGEGTPLAALRRFVLELAGTARAEALTASALSAEAAFRVFASLEAYESEVLGARRA